MGCVKGQLGRCVQEVWQMEPCPSSTICVAVPTLAGTGIGANLDLVIYCTSLSNALSLIEETGVPGGLLAPSAGSTTLAPTAAPTSTSTVASSSAPALQTPSSTSNPATAIQPASSTSALTPTPVQPTPSASAPTSISVQSTTISSAAAPTSNSLLQSGVEAQEENSQFEKLSLHSFCGVGG